MTKEKLLKLIKHLPKDAIIGFRASDLGPDCPAEQFDTGWDLDDTDFAKREQDIDFILV